MWLIVVCVFSSLFCWVFFGSLCGYHWRCFSVCCGQVSCTSGRGVFCGVCWDVWWCLNVLFVCVGVCWVSLFGVWVWRTRERRETRERVGEEKRRWFHVLGRGSIFFFSLRDVPCGCWWVVVVRGAKWVCEEESERERERERMWGVSGWGWGWVVGAGRLWCWYGGGEGEGREGREEREREGVCVCVQVELERRKGEKEGSVKDKCWNTLVARVHGNTCRTQRSCWKTILWILTMEMTFLLDTEYVGLCDLFVIQTLPSLSNNSQCWSHGIYLCRHWFFCSLSSVDTPMFLIIVNKRRCSSYRYNTSLKLLCISQWLTCVFDSSRLQGEFNIIDASSDTVVAC